MSKRKPGSAGSPGEGSGAAMKPAESTPHYLVLARKYRPRTFVDLIGQEAMVRTLRNAFATGRIAQAYMLTGVRGVGKTTTARILARALNYSLPGKDTGPTIDMTELGEHCQAIMDSRHPDVLEMDAASNTGIDNVREIIESARYRPIAARTKVYIIDEVHMLSKGAFNALLKTLEEPPEHVKFIFATTEVRKVPVTVLSRCQRFDLRRVDVETLTEHFRAIAKTESMAIDNEALTTIARAAEGSVRDGLSVLDQAFSTAQGKVTAALVRQMLGLADRGRILDLLERLLAGQAADALAQFEALHKDGADPAQVLAELAEAIHAVTRIRVGGERAASDLLSGDERKRAAALAGKLGIGLLSRAWQMLLKGFEEALRAPDGFTAAEMVLIRLAYMAELPSPDDLLRKLSASPDAAATGVRTELGEQPPSAPQRSPLNQATAIVERPANAPLQQPKPGASGPVFRRFEDLVDFVGEKRDALLKLELEERVSLVRFEPPHVEVSLLPGADPGLATDLAQKLAKWTGTRWMVALSREVGERPLAELRREREAADIEAVRQHPLMRKVLESFPDAEITAVRKLASDPVQLDDDDSAAS